MSLVFADHPAAAHAADEIDSGRLAAHPPGRFARRRPCRWRHHPPSAHYATTATVIYVSRQLAAYQAAALQKGIISLANHRKTVNGAVARHHYRRAVYGYTPRPVLETYADYSACRFLRRARRKAKQAQAGDAILKRMAPLPTFSAAIAPTWS